MLALILALLAAPELAPTAAPAALPNTLSGVTVQGESKTKPPPADIRINMQASDDDVYQQVVIWPGAAYQSHVDGRVRLRCKIDIHGLAETCEVASESPAGRGFGRAALELRPTFKLSPTMASDGPVAVTKTISISFKAPDTQISMQQIASTWR